MKMDFNMFRFVVIFWFAPTVFSAIHEDIARAIVCVKQHNLPVDDLFQQITMCYRQQLHITRDISKDYIEHIIQGVCRINDPTSCLEKHTEPFRRTCLSQSLQEVFARVLNATTVGYAHACHDNGAKIIEFYKSGGIQCVDELFNGPNSKLYNCALKLLGTLRDKLEDAGEHKGKQREVECWFGHQARTCILDNFESCAKPKEILRDFMDEMFASSECPNSSGRLQAPYVIIFLLSFAILYLLYK